MKKIVFTSALLFLAVTVNAQTYTFMRRSLYQGNIFTAFDNPYNNSIYIIRTQMGTLPFPDYFDVAKVDTAGNIVANLCFNYDSLITRIEAVCPYAGGFYVGGNDQGIGEPVTSALIAQVDMNGSVNWAKKYSGTDDISLRPAMVDAASNTIICIGTVYAGFPNNPVFVLTMDITGAILSVKAFTLNLTSGYGVYSASLNRKSNGNYLFMVNHMSSGNWETPYILELDSTFNLSSAKKFLGIGGTSCSMLLKPDDGFYIIGSQSFIAPNANGFVVNFSPSMSVIWAKQTDYTIDSPVDISGADFSGNGGLVLGGSYYLQDGNSDMMMIELDSLGSVQWTRRIGDSGHNEYLTSLICRPGDAIYATAQWSDTNLVDHWGGFYRIDLSGNTTCDEDTFSTGFYDFNVVVTNQNVATATFSLSTANEVTSPLPGFTMVTLCNGVVTDKEEINVSTAIQIYPNPAHNTFTISFNGLSSIVNGHLQIFDVMGREVHEQTLANQSTIIDKQFSAGIYFVKVQVGENVFAEKLVVE
jgi:hypothetical protein